MRHAREWPRTRAAGCLVVVLLASCGRALPPPRERVVQPVQEYFLDFRGKSPFRAITHIGSDYGPMGTAESRLAWRGGRIEAALGEGQWVGMWHSLEGLARERDRTLDFARCYPRFIRPEAQPRCVGVVVRAQGTGPFEVNIKSEADEVIWKRRTPLDAADEVREIVFDCDPAALREAKVLSWRAEGEGRVSVDFIGLALEPPRMPFAKRVFLTSYAKLARCYEQTDGVVKDRAHAPHGATSGVPASGMFCLATAAAWQLGMVDRAFAEQALHRVHATIGTLPRAAGLLPHFIRRRGKRYERCPGSEFSTVDTSLYYHGMLVAAEMLDDRALVDGLTREIKAIDFGRLRNADGYVLHGLRGDGRTPIPHAWRGWGGEAALVLLVERMAAGDAARLKMAGSGRVFQGRGFIAEVQSLFYPHFSQDRPDAVSGVNWLAARRALLAEQMEALPRDSAAARLGLYGLSAGEGPRGVGYVAQGTRTRAKADLIHPHYFLMSAALREPGEVYAVLRAMERRGLFPPWGMVENVKTDLSEYLPMLGSLNAAFEALAAYHLWAKAAGQPDAIYEAARRCPLLADAIRAFYPPATP